MMCSSASAGWRISQCWFVRRQASHHRLRCNSLRTTPKFMTHSNPRLMRDNSKLILVLSAVRFCHIRLVRAFISLQILLLLRWEAALVCSAAVSSPAPIGLWGLPEEEINGTTFSFTAIKTPVVPLGSSWRPYPNGSVAFLWRLD